MRSCRLRSATRRAVAVTRCTGRSTRPAISQPKPTADAATSAKASRDCRSSDSKAWVRCSAAARTTSSIGETSSPDRSLTNGWSPRCIVAGMSSSEMNVRASASPCRPCWTSR
jgi:hypothetical protein